MDPVTLGLLVNAGGLIAKQFMGANRPEYEIPDSARQALAQARILQADKNMPGEQKALEQVGISAANSVAAAREGGNVLEAISAIQGQQDRGTQGILARSEADQRSDEERLMQQLGIMAQYEDQRFQMNEFAPYAEGQQETRDIIGAMGQNAANLLLSQQTKAAIGGDNEISEGVQPKSEEVGEYGSVDVSKLTEYPGFGSFLNAPERPFTTPGVTPSIPGIAGMDADQIRKLLLAIQSGTTN